MTVTVPVTLSRSGPTGYTVRDYWGNVVSSGTITGTSFTLAQPASGDWKPGWYRIYMTGPTNDATFGHSAGASNFVVVRTTPGYPANTVGSPATGGGEARDVVMKGILGVGFSRLQISDAANINTGVDSLAACEGDATLLTTYYRNDPNRERPLMCQFPNAGFDYGTVFDPGNSTDDDALYIGQYLRLYPKDPSLGGSISYDVGPGSSSGTKIRIFYPNTSTVAETFDNLPAGGSSAQPLITSAYVNAIDAGGVAGGKTHAVRTIGTARRDGIISVVQGLYPLGVTRYEGPINEPRLYGTRWAAEGVEQMRVFQANVHTGNASAKAIGPCPVDITPGSWTDWLTAGGAAYCDELSFHDYNAITAGDFNLGRASIETFQAMLVSYGVHLPLWQTEATHAFMSVFGIHHPRRSRIPLIQTLLWEQYGMPRERNLVWYDISHGFWSYPAWLEYADGSLSPYAALYRTLSEETYGKTHDHRIDFGSVQGNRIFLGSIYRSPTDDSSTAVVVSHSYIPGATVTLTVTGTTLPLQYVDSWGNMETLTQTSGRVTVPVTDTPSYLRLPAGVRCSVYSCNDWGSNPPPNISLLANGLVSGSATPAICDNAYITDYANQAGVTISAISPPDTADLLWNGTVNVDRVIIWCGSPWQNDSSLAAFDIQTTTDGVTWTTRKTITKTVDSFFFGTASDNAGCTRETFWDEQWIFDVPLGATYACTGVRVNVTATSYGGEPDAYCVAGSLGQGNAAQHLTLQEISVPSASAPPTWNPLYKTAVLADSPAGYWRVGEASGATTAVSQVNSPTVDGTYVGGPILGTSSAIGDGDTAMTPNSVGYATVAHNALLDVADDFTIEFWLKLTSLIISNNVIFGQGNDGSGHSCPIGKLIDNYPSLVFYPSTVVAQTTNAISDGGWHHYCFTKNGSAIKVYVDGVDATSSSIHTHAPYTVDTTKTFSNLTNPLYIGSDGGDKLSGGSIDEFAWYPAAISSTRVAAHFAAASTPGGSPLLATAPFLEGEAVVGSQIACTTGLWSSPSPVSFSYQWQRSADGSTGWANVAGEARSDTIIGSALAGQYLRCNVTAKNISGNTTTIASNVKGPVA